MIFFETKRKRNEITKNFYFKGPALYIQSYTEILKNNVAVPFLCGFLNVSEFSYSLKIKLLKKNYNH